MEAGVRNGAGFVTTKSTLVAPVQSTVGVGVAALAAGGDTVERGAEPVEEKHKGRDDTKHSSQAQVQFVIDICSLEGVDLGAQHAGKIEDIQERHSFLILLSGTEEEVFCLLSDFITWIKLLF